MSSRVFSLPAQFRDIWVVYANCHRGNLFKRCELDKRNRSWFYSIWETESSRPCEIPSCDIQRTVLWKNLSHVEMRLERVKNHKPKAIDTQRFHRNHWSMINEGPRVCFKGKQNTNLFNINMKSKYTLLLFAGLVVYGCLVHVILKRKSLVFLWKSNNMLWFWMICPYISTLVFHGHNPIHPRWIKSRSSLWRSHWISCFIVNPCW